jgi:N-acetylneuraminate synthase
MARITIGNAEIGVGRPTFIVAEMSGNHNQSFEHALNLVSAAKDAGADAIKIQTYTPDTITLDCDDPPFWIEGTAWAGKRLYDLYGEAHTPWDWQPRLKDAAEDLGLTFFSTPFDPSAVDFLEGIDSPAYKIASFELVDIPLIRRVAATGKPLIMSTGMASLEEIGEAVSVARESGAEEIALLKCVSAYPAPESEMNLLTIPDLMRRFDVQTGLSDHTLGSEIAVAAVAVGAAIIEKHLTLSRADGGPDSGFSLEPREFGAMVETIRLIEKALGAVSYGPTASESASLAHRRSLFIVKDVARGEVLTESNVRSIRPGCGLPPRELDRVIGKRVTRDLARGTPLSWEDIDHA